MKQIDTKEKILEDWNKLNLIYFSNFLELDSYLKEKCKEQGMPIVKKFFKISQISRRDMNMTDYDEIKNKKKGMKLNKAIILFRQHIKEYKKNEKLDLNNKK